MALEGALEALGATPAAPARTGGAEFRVPADVTAKRTVDRLRILQDELGRTTDPEDKAALQREIAGLPKAERAPAAPVSEPGPLSGALEALSTPAEAPAASRAPAAPTGEPTAAELAAASKPAGYSDVTAPSSTPQFREGPTTLSSLITGGNKQKLNPLQTRMLGRYVPPNAPGLPGINEAAEGVGGAITDVGTKIGLPPRIAAIPGVAANLAVQAFGQGPGAAVKGAASALKAGARGLRFLGGAAGFDVSGGAARSAMGSVGSAGTSAPEMARASVQNASPQLRETVERAIKSGQPINQRILDNYVAAESLPHPVSISKGQAAESPVLISEERNLRAQYKKLGEGFAEADASLKENLPLIRAQAAPEAFGTTQAQHGQSIMGVIDRIDAAKNDVIAANYKALEDANGGRFPMDVNAFVRDATAQLHKKLKYNHVPAEIAKDIRDVQKNGMNFEEFEALRTNLATAQRTNKDGNARAAAGIIRRALEDMPMPKEFVGSSLEGSAMVDTNLKSLADKARASAKERFDLLDANPAYKSVVEGDANSEDFIRKHVFNGKKKDVEQLMGSLDDEGKQSVRAGLIDMLERESGIVDGKGTFSQSSYNKAVDKLRQSGKLDLLFEPETRKQLETLGHVARLTQQQPAGSYVNNSNTLVSALSEGAKNTAAGAVNVLAHGLPVGTGGLKLSRMMAERKAAKEAFRPGAGVLLRDLVK